MQSNHKEAVPNDESLQDDFWGKNRPSEISEESFKKSKDSTKKIIDNIAKSFARIKSYLSNLEKNNNGQFSCIISDKMLIQSLSQPVRIGFDREMALDKGRVVSTRALNIYLHQGQASVIVMEASNNSPIQLSFQGGGSCHLSKLLVYSAAGSLELNAAIDQLSIDHVDCFSQHEVLLSGAWNCQRLDMHAKRMSTAAGSMLTLATGKITAVKNISHYGTICAKHNETASLELLAGDLLSVKRFREDRYNYEHVGRITGFDTCELTATNVRYTIGEQDSLGVLTIKADAVVFDGCEEKFHYGRELSGLLEAADQDVQNNSEKNSPWSDRLKSFLFSSYISRSKQVAYEKKVTEKTHEIIRVGQYIKLVKLDVNCRLSFDKSPNASLAVLDELTINSKGSVAFHGVTNTSEKPFRGKFAIRSKDKLYLSGFAQLGPLATFDVSSDAGIVYGHQGERKQSFSIIRGLEELNIDGIKYKKSFLLRSGELRGNARETSVVKEVDPCESKSCLERFFSSSEKEGLSGRVSGPNEKKKMLYSNLLSNDILMSAFSDDATIVSMVAENDIALKGGCYSGQNILIYAKNDVISDAYIAAHGVISLSADRWVSHRGISKAKSISICGTVVVNSGVLIATDACNRNAFLLLNYGATCSPMTTSLAILNISAGLGIPLYFDDWRKVINRNNLSQALMIAGFIFLPGIAIPAMLLAKGLAFFRGVYDLSLLAHSHSKGEEKRYWQETIKIVSGMTDALNMAALYTQGFSASGVNDLVDGMQDGVDPMEQTLALAKDSDKDAALLGVTLGMAVAGDKNTKRGLVNIDLGVTATSNASDYSGFYYGAGACVAVNKIHQGQMVVTNGYGAVAREAVTAERIEVSETQYTAWQASYHANGSMILRGSLYNTHSNAQFSADNINIMGSQSFNHCVFVCEDGICVEGGTIKLIRTQMQGRFLTVEEDGKVYASHCVMSFDSDINLDGTLIMTKGILSAGDALNIHGQLKAELSQVKAGDVDNSGKLDLIGAQLSAQNMANAQGASVTMQDAQLAIEEKLSNEGDIETTGNNYIKAASFTQDSGTFNAEDEAAINLAPHVLDDPDGPDESGDDNDDQDDVDPDEDDQDEVVQVNKLTLEIGPGGLENLHTDINAKEIVLINLDGNSHLKDLYLKEGDCAHLQWTDGLGLVENVDEIIDFDISDEGLQNFLLEAESIVIRTDVEINVEGDLVLSATDATKAVAGEEISNEQNNAHSIIVEKNAELNAGNAISLHCDGDLILKESQLEAKAYIEITAKGNVYNLSGTITSEGSIYIDALNFRQVLISTPLNYSGVQGEDQSQAVQDEAQFWDKHYQDEIFDNDFNYDLKLDGQFTRIGIIKNGNLIDTIVIPRSVIEDPSSEESYEILKEILGKYHLSYKGILDLLADNPQDPDQNNYQDIVPNSYMSHLFEDIHNHYSRDAEDSYLQQHGPTHKHGKEFQENVEARAPQCSAENGAVIINAHATLDENEVPGQVDTLPDSSDGNVSNVGGEISGAYVEINADGDIDNLAINTEIKTNHGRIQTCLGASILGGQGYEGGDGVGLAIHALGKFIHDSSTIGASGGVIIDVGSLRAETQHTQYCSYRHNSSHMFGLASQEIVRYQTLFFNAKIFSINGGIHIVTDGCCKLQATQVSSRTGTDISAGGDVLLTSETGHAFTKTSSSFAGIHSGSGESYDEYISATVIYDSASDTMLIDAPDHLVELKGSQIDSSGKANIHAKDINIHTEKLHHWQTRSGFDFSASMGPANYNTDAGFNISGAGALIDPLVAIAQAFGQTPDALGTALALNTTAINSWNSYYQWTNAFNAGGLSALLKANFGVINNHPNIELSLGFNHSESSYDSIGQAGIHSADDIILEADNNVLLIGGAKVEAENITIVAENFEGTAAQLHSHFESSHDSLSIDMATNVGASHSQSASSSTSYVGSEVLAKSSVTLMISGDTKLDGSTIRAKSVVVHTSSLEMISRVNTSDSSSYGYGFKTNGQCNLNFSDGHVENIALAGIEAGSHLEVNATSIHSTGGELKSHGDHDIRADEINETKLETNSYDHAISLDGNVKDAFVEPGSQDHHVSYVSVDVEQNREQTSYERGAGGDGLEVHGSSSGFSYSAQVPVNNYINMFTAADAALSFGRPIQGVSEVGMQQLAHQEKVKPTAAQERAATTLLALLALPEPGLDIGQSPSGSDSNADVTARAVDNAMMASNVIGSEPNRTVADDTASVKSSVTKKQAGVEIDSNASSADDIDFMLQNGWLYESANSLGDNGSLELSSSVLDIIFGKAYSAEPVVFDQSGVVDVIGEDAYEDSRFDYSGGEYALAFGKGAVSGFVWIYDNATSMALLGLDQLVPDVWKSEVYEEDVADAAEVLQSDWLGIKAMGNFTYNIVASPFSQQAREHVSEYYVAGKYFLSNASGPQLLETATEFLAPVGLLKLAHAFAASREVAGLEGIVPGEVSQVVAEDMQIAEIAPLIVSDLTPTSMIPISIEELLTIDVRQAFSQKIIDSPWIADGMFGNTGYIAQLQLDARMSNSGMAFPFIIDLDNNALSVAYPFLMDGSPVGDAISQGASSSIKGDLLVQRNEFYKNGLEFRVRYDSAYTGEAFVEEKAFITQVFEQEGLADANKLFDGKYNALSAMYEHIKSFNSDPRLSDKNYLGLAALLSSSDNSDASTLVVANQNSKNSLQPEGFNIAEQNLLPIHFVSQDIQERVMDQEGLGDYGLAVARGLYHAAEPALLPFYAAIASLRYGVDMEDMSPTVQRIVGYSQSEVVASWQSIRAADLFIKDAIFDHSSQASERMGERYVALAGLVRGATGPDVIELIVTFAAPEFVIGNLTKTSLPSSMSLSVSSKFDEIYFYAAANQDVTEIVTATKNKFDVNRHYPNAMFSLSNEIKESIDSSDLVKALRIRHIENKFPAQTLKFDQGVMSMGWRGLSAEFYPSLITQIRGVDLTQLGADVSVSLTRSGLMHFSGLSIQDDFNASVRAPKTVNYWDDDSFFSNDTKVSRFWKDEVYTRTSGQLEAAVNEHLMRSADEGVFEKEFVPFEIFEQERAGIFDGLPVTSYRTFGRDMRDYHMAVNPQEKLNKLQWAALSAGLIYSSESDAGEIYHEGVESDSGIKQDGFSVNQQHLLPINFISKKFEADLPATHAVHDAVREDVLIPAMHGVYDSAKIALMPFFSAVSLLDYADIQDPVAQNMIHYCRSEIVQFKQSLLAPSSLAIGVAGMVHSNGFGSAANAAYEKIALAADMTVPQAVRLVVTLAAPGALLKGIESASSSLTVVGKFMHDYTPPAKAGELELSAVNELSEVVSGEQAQQSSFVSSVGKMAQESDPVLYSYDIEKVNAEGGYVDTTIVPIAEGDLLTMKDVISSRPDENFVNFLRLYLGDDHAGASESIEESYADYLETGMQEFPFVITSSNELLMTREWGARFDNEMIGHYSLAKGRPVLAAGMVVVNDGEVVEINNHSGHYRTNGPHVEELITNQFIKEGLGSAKDMYRPHSFLDRLNVVSSEAMQEIGKVHKVLEERAQKAQIFVYLESSIAKSNEFTPKSLIPITLDDLLALDLGEHFLGNQIAETPWMCAMPVVELATVTSPICESYLAGKAVTFPFVIDLNSQILEIFYPFLVDATPASHEVSQIATPAIRGEILIHKNTLFPTQSVFRVFYEGHPDGDIYSREKQLISQAFEREGLSGVNGLFIGKEQVETNPIFEDVMQGKGSALSLLSMSPEEVLQEVATGVGGDVLPAWPFAYVEIDPGEALAFHAVMEDNRRQITQQIRINHQRVWDWCDEHPEALKRALPEISMDNSLAEVIELPLGGRSDVAESSETFVSDGGADVIEFKPQLDPLMAPMFYDAEVFDLEEENALALNELIGRLNRELEERAHSLVKSRGDMHNGESGDAFVDLARFVAIAALLGGANEADSHPSVVLDDASLNWVNTDENRALTVLALGESSAGRYEFLGNGQRQLLAHYFSQKLAADLLVTQAVRDAVRENVLVPVVKGIYDSAELFLLPYYGAVSLLSTADIQDPLAQSIINYAKNEVVSALSSVRQLELFLVHALDVSLDGNMQLVTDYITVKEGLATMTAPQLVEFSTALLAPGALLKSFDMAANYRAFGLMNKPPMFRPGISDEVYVATGALDNDVLVHPARGYPAFEVVRATEWEDIYREWIFWASRFSSIHPELIISVDEIISRNSLLEMTNELERFTSARGFVAVDHGSGELSISKAFSEQLNELRGSHEHGAVVEDYMDFIQTRELTYPYIITDSGELIVSESRHANGNVVLSTMITGFDDVAAAAAGWVLVKYDPIAGQNTIVKIDHFCEFYPFEGNHFEKLIVSRFEKAGVKNAAEIYVPHFSSQLLEGYTSTKIDPALKPYGLAALLGSLGVLSMQDYDAKSADSRVAARSVNENRFFSLRFVSGDECKAGASVSCS
jgi:hypothetical protein